jgi:hypothetical protein
LHSLTILKIKLDASALDVQRPEDSTGAELELQRGDNLAADTYRHE